MVSVGLKRPDKCKLVIGQLIFNCFTTESTNEPPAVRLGWGEAKHIAPWGVYLTGVGYLYSKGGLLLSSLLNPKQINFFTNACFLKILPGISYKVKLSSLARHFNVRSNLFPRKEERILENHDATISYLNKCNNSVAMKMIIYDIKSTDFSSVAFEAF